MPVLPSATAFSRRASLSRADRATSAIFGVIAGLTVLLLLGIFLFLAGNALPAFRQIPLGDFFFSTDWNPVSYHEARWGIVSLVLGTLLIVVCSLAVALPLGLCTAIYLAEIASPRSREILKPLIEMIAGVPSVVLGLLGLLFLAPLLARALHLSNGLNALSASLLVAIVTMPSIASMCEDALAGVPRSLRQASLALGAGRWRTIMCAVLPAARSGLTAAAMLGLGRAIGETMIVLMVAGNSLELPSSLLDSVRPMTATIAIEIKEVVTGSVHWSALFAIGLLLFFFTLAINMLVDVLIRKQRLS